MHAMPLSRLRLANIALTSCLAVAVARLCPANQRDNESGADAVRVGGVAFGEGRTERSLQILRQVAAASESPLRFQVASGTYGDVAHWISKGHIDLAVVTPGLFTPGEAPSDQVRYLATVAVAPAITRLAS